MAKHPGGTDMHALTEDRAEEERAKGPTVYVIAGGGSNAVGALGYANVAMERVGRAAAMGLGIAGSCTPPAAPGSRRGS